MGLPRKSHRVIWTEMMRLVLTTADEDGSGFPDWYVGRSTEASGRLHWHGVQLRADPCGAIWSISPEWRLARSGAVLFDVYGFWLAEDLEEAIAVESDAMALGIQGDPDFEPEGNFVFVYRVRPYTRETRLVERRRVDAARR